MEPFYLRHRAPVAVTAGFTILELIVVSAIIMTITAIALSSQNSFNKSLLLANTAYDLALTLRSAENFGIGSRAVSSIANAGYGLHFQRGTPGSFILFADTAPAVASSCVRPDCRPGDHLYSTDDTLVQTYTLGNNITVSDFCTTSDRSQCASTGDISSLDIVFSRPNPDAFIRANGSSYNAYTAACITLSSESGGERYIAVEASGQILAEAASCP